MNVSRAVLAPFGAGTGTSSALAAKSATTGCPSSGASDPANPDPEREATKVHQITLTQ